MKKVFAITAVAGLLAVGCSSNDADTGGTYDSTGASWSSDSNTGHMSGSETRGIGTDMTPNNTSTLPQSQQQQKNTELDATTSGTVESGQSSYSPTNSGSALPNSSGSAPTPGGSDTGADSSSGNLDTNSNTNNVDGSLDERS